MIVAHGRVDAARIFHRIVIGLADLVSRAGKSRATRIDGGNQTGKFVVGAAAVFPFDGITFADDRRKNRQAHHLYHGIAAQRRFLFQPVAARIQRIVLRRRKEPRLVLFEVVLPDLRGVAVGVTVIRPQQRFQRLERL